MLVSESCQAVQHSWHCHTALYYIFQDFRRFPLLGDWLLWISCRSARNCSQAPAYVNAYFWLSAWRKLFETKSYGRLTSFGEIVFLIKESMIASSNTKISRTFLCDELVQLDATDPSTCTYQDSPSHCSCQIRTCMSQYDSMQLMDRRLSLLELSPSEFDSPMTGMLKAFTNTYSQLASLKKSWW